MKERGEKIAVWTAYDFTMARLLDRAGIDVILVGDSLGMVVLGYDNTLPVTLDMMIHHTRAVSRGAKRALIVADMPFLTFQLSVEEAMRNAGRLIQQGGAAAVKIEGGRQIVETAKRLGRYRRSGHGTSRIDAAVRASTGRISSAGPRFRSGRPPDAGCRDAGEGRRFRHRSRIDSSRTWPGESRQA